MHAEEEGQGQGHADCLGAVCLFSAGLREHLQRPRKKTHNVDFDLGNKAGMWFLLVPLFRAEPSLSSGEGKELDRRAHSQSTGGRSRGP